MEPEPPLEMGAKAESVLVKDGNQNVENEMKSVEEKPIDSTTIDNIENPTTLLTYPPSEHRRMLRNVIIISLSFTLLFSGYSTMSNLQSSLNNDIKGQEGLGTYSQATVYTTMLISSMFFAPYFIQLVGCRWAVAVSMLGYGLYIGAQFYPTFYTLLPTAALVGLCAAPLWAAKSTYLTHLGHEYARLRSDISDVVIVRFFGIFFFLFQTHAIWVNLLSSLVLKNSDSNSTADDMNTCGANFCPHSDEDDDEDDDEEESKTEVYILASACLFFALCACAVVSLFVDSMQRYGEHERKVTNGGKLTGKKLAMATVKQMMHPYQLLIIPITIWSGLEQGFLSADITRAYVTCSWGIDKIGWTLMCYGVVDAVGSLSFGPAVRRFGRVPVFIFGALINIGLLITLLLWRPTPDEPYVYFLITGLWGFADSVWQTQINAVYGVLFPAKEEAAFSNYRLWESAGFIVSFVWADLVCVRPKIFFLFGWLVFGMGLYLVVEWRLWMGRRKVLDLKNVVK